VRPRPLHDGRGLRAGVSAWIGCGSGRQSADLVEIARTRGAAGTQPRQVHPHADVAGSHRRVRSIVSASLFPTAPNHLRLHCSCPDWVNVCKHVGATCYLLGEQFDEDPFLLFRLRGRGQDEVLEGLRRRAGGAHARDARARPSGDAPGADEVTTATIDAARAAAVAAPLGLDGFWTAGGAPPSIDLPAERPDLSLLRRLGPIKALDDDLLARLGPVYRSVAAAATSALEAADAGPATEGEDDGPTAA
jgi:hypothetical protein